MTRSVLITIAAITSILITYLVVQAPPPLASDRVRGASIPICRVFETTNLINTSARRIYTERIVGPGKRAGLAFDEHWKDRAVEAGPLPALFLRELAMELERDPVELGLFLGSADPINEANAFSPDQRALFEALAADREPRFGSTDEIQFGMFADIASAPACVTCHNEHPDTPKTDWALGDVMGATTWTHPRSQVSAQEYAAMIDATYRGIEASYGSYLRELEGHARPPEIGAGWPSEGYEVPSARVYMDALRSVTAQVVLAQMLLSLDPDHEPEGCLAE